MIAIRLREAIAAYKRRTGRRMTYAILAEMTGIAEGTLNQIGSRDDYNATLRLIEKLCLALNVTPADLLELVHELPKPKRAAGRKKGGRRGTGSGATRVC
jgi:DNA-binding Xre family transcriptional regulator